MGKNERRKQRPVDRSKERQEVAGGAGAWLGLSRSISEGQPQSRGRAVGPAFEKPRSPNAFTRAGAPPIQARASARPTSRTPRRKPESTVPVAEERHVPIHNCAGMLADAEPQGLVATYAFDTSNWTSTGPVAIGFAGTRIDGAGQPVDRFERVERLADLGPRTGKVAITTRLGHLAPGKWRVVAGPVENPARHPLPHKAILTSTQFSLLAQGPGVRLFAWPALVGLGAVLAVLVQGFLAAWSGLPVAPILAATVVGCLLGSVGGKAWFLAVNRRPLRDFLSSGACIQGFLLVSLAVLVAGAMWIGISPGAVLDVTAPGIFLGMAVGRPGCFLTGCCVGRPTTSRWGLWSSDRRLGIRRVPVQLFEAVAALLIGAAALILVLGVTAPFPGAVFAGAMAAYTLARQSLFRLRSHSHTRLGRHVVQVLCGVVLLGVMVTFLTA